MRTYLITFACYGAWLPGKSGTVHASQNRFGSPTLEPDFGHEERSRSLLTQEPYLLDSTRQAVVLTAFEEVCFHRGWTLLAAHVRTNHAHAVTIADRKPEQVMHNLKAYASRALNKLALDEPNRHRWARHGSTRYLWTPERVASAVSYVLEQQGEPLAMYASVSERSQPTNQSSPGKTSPPNPGNTA